MCTQALEADFIAHHVLQDNVRTNIRRTYLYYVQDLHMYIHTDACKHARMHAITLHYDHYVLLECTASHYIAAQCNTIHLTHIDIRTYVNINSCLSTYARTYIIIHT